MYTLHFGNKIRVIVNIFAEAIKLPSLDDGKQSLSHRATSAKIIIIAKLIVNDKLLHINKNIELFCVKGKGYGFLCILTYTDDVLG